MDSKSSIYNIHFCRLCQNPKKLDLVPTSDNSQSKNGKSCWDTFKYIFSEIDWVEDRLLSLICRTCLKNTYDCAEFKKQCLETNCQRKQFNNKYIELITEPVDKETDAVDEREQKNANAEPPIEEVILPCTEEIMQEDVFVKTEKVDDIDSRTTNQEASSSVLEPSSSVLEASLSVVRDPVVTKKKIPDNSQRKRKLEANQISRASIKNSKYRIPSTDVRRETSASVPYNVTLISTRLSEFIPVHNPKSFETVCKICQSIFQDPFELRLHIATLHRRKVPRGEEDSEDSDDDFYYDPTANLEDPEEEEKSETVASDSALSNVPAYTANLPEKSKRRYETTHNEFKKWREQKNYTEVTEEVLMAFFLERSEKLKSPASLWSEYSMLKTTLYVIDKIDIARYGGLKSYLKRKHVGYRPRQCRAFTRDDIDRFLTEAPDEKYLFFKVAIIIGIAGACHKHELRTLTVDDIQDNGDMITVCIPDATNEGAARTFTISDDDSTSDRSPRCLQIYRKYARLRPTNTEQRRFFMRYQRNHCSNQVVGKNTFSKVPSSVARYLNLPNPTEYTGYSLRKTSMMLFNRADRQILGMTRSGDWKLPQHGV